MRCLVALLFALSTVACGGDDPAPAKSAPPPRPSAPAEPAAAPSAADPSTAEPSAPASTSGSDAAGESKPKEAEAPRGGAHVSFSGAGGRVHWVGEIPTPKTLLVNAETAKDCHHDGPMDTSDPSLVVDATAGVANVVIEVEVAGGEPAVPAQSFTMDQHGCRFAPHVLLVPKGATVEYGNSDPFTHNVNVVPKRNDGMNVMVDGGAQRSATYAESDVIQIKCDVHPWMGAWVYVSDAPVHALSASDGSFALPALPPGSHKVSCWHESLGKASGTLVVGEGGAIGELDLVLGKKR